MNKSYHIYIKDMTCVNCEYKLHEGLSHVEGVIEVKVSYKKNLIHIIISNISIEYIEEQIKHIGYTVKSIKSVNLDNNIADNQGMESKGNKIFSTIVILLGSYFILKQLGILEIFQFVPMINQDMGYGMLFLIGVLTSIHCVGMCGGINITQSVMAQREVQGEISHSDCSKDTSCEKSSRCNKDISCDENSRSNKDISCDENSRSKKNTPCGANVRDKKNATYHKKLLISNFNYNLGRVVSYTLIGGLVGGIGSVLTIALRFQGIVAIIAGVFMIIMGCNMMNLFPWLKALNISMPKIFTKIIRSKKNRNQSSFYIGLLNGLMPCGPLQSMQLYALSTGSILTGAISMFAFSIGTVPIMYLFGTMIATLGTKLRHTISNLSAVLVVFLGVSMLWNGIGLSGYVVPSISNIAAFISGEEQSTMLSGMMEGNSQRIYSELDYGTYPNLLIKVDVPVVWTIHATEETLNGCNNEIIINEYGIKQKLVVGDNEIHFTPKKTGTFGYSCWMGMIRSRIKVVT